MMKRKAQKALAGIAAVIAATYGAMELWSIGYSARFLADAGSGGIGAVSVGLFEEIVPLAAGAAANRVLVRWARRAGGTVLALHRVHSIMLLLVAGLVVLSVILLTQLGAGTDVRLWIAFDLITGFAFSAQSICLAVILAFFVAKTPVSAT